MEPNNQSAAQTRRAGIPYKPVKSSPDKSPHKSYVNQTQIKTSKDNKIVEKL